MIVLSIIFSLKHSKANNLASTNLLFTLSWSSMEKNKILFVAIYKGELNLQQGGEKMQKPTQNAISVANFKMLVKVAWRVRNVWVPSCLTGA